jgi:flagellar biosynthesis component FlhA
MGGCLLVIGIVVMVFWLLGFIVLDLGALIHIALVVGVIFIILWLLKAVFKLF